MTFALPTFAQPWWLGLLLALPPLLWWWSRHRGAALRHPTTALASQRRTWRAWAALRGPLVLRALALTLLVLALAGPRWPDLRTRIRTEGIAILMVVDVSGSMAADDFHWHDQPVTRLE